MSSSSSQLPRPSYIPIRDDARTLSLAERHFTLAAGDVLRVDGRAHDAARPVSLEMDHRNGSSIVQWGAGTRVHCRVVADLVAPNPQQQPSNQGRWICSVDISPAARTSARRAAPVSTAYSSAVSSDTARNSSQEANAILRTLEQCWAGEDREALCIVPGQLCWQIHAQVTVLDDAGNATDAAVLAATAALRHFRLPHVRLVDGTAILDYEKEPLPLPLHHAPLTVSLIQLLDASEKRRWLLLDPTDREALGAVGHVTWGLSAPYGEILFCDSAGANVGVSHLRTSHGYALAQAARLHAVLAQALAQAEPFPWPVAARRMHRPNEEKPDDDMDDAAEGMDATTATTTTTTEEEEAYRRRALDYTMRHVATAVRDDPPPPRR